jgi:hypothetical protein
MSALGLVLQPTKFCGCADVKKPVSVFDGLDFLQGRLDCQFGGHLIGQFRGSCHSTSSMQFQTLASRNHKRLVSMDVEKPALGRFGFFRASEAYAQLHHPFFVCASGIHRVRFQWLLPFYPPSMQFQALAFHNCKRLVGMGEKKPLGGGLEFWGERSLRSLNPTLF